MPNKQLPVSEVEETLNLTASTVDKCIPKDSWFREYMGCWPLSESPKSYILLSAMSMMGACLGRKVWLWQDYRAIWPMLNLLLIGPSGIGKSTSIDMARGLLDNIPLVERPQFIGSTTPEKLHEDLLVNPHAILFASELANFFNRQEYNANLVPYVTELLDYRAVERRTKGGMGIVRVDEPSVTVIGGSTVEWLQEQLPDSAVSGGFLARFLICQEDCKSQKVADPDSALSEGERRKLDEKRFRVFGDFARLVGGVTGRLSFEGYGALDAYTVWYSSHNPISGHLAPFAARAPEFVKRFAGLFAVSRGSNSISELDVEGALALYRYCEKKLQGVVVPMSPKGKLLEQVLTAIGDQPRTFEEISQAMRNFITAQECQTFLTSLSLSKDLTINDDGKFIRKWN
jgi:hypothetical protein